MGVGPSLVQEGKNNSDHHSPIKGYHIPESYPKWGPPVALQYIRESHTGLEAPHKIDKSSRSY